MSMIKNKLKQRLEDCLILLDEDFQRQYPGIVKVAEFLNATAITYYRIMGRYKPFDMVGVDNIKDYIKLIENGNIKAIKTYESVRDILRFE